MNLMNRTMSYENSNKLNIDGTEKVCNCEKCKSIENQIVEYSSLSKEEIEQIIEERYSNKDEKTKTFIRKALRCQLCIIACPKNVIALAQKKVNVHGYPYVEAALPDECIGCASCAIVCPDGCITVYRKKMEG